MDRPAFWRIEHRPANFSVNSTLMKGCIMSEQVKCLRCGGTNLIPGVFQSTGKVYFRPKEAKLITFHSSGVAVDAKSCLDCGHLELLVDTDKAKALTKNS